MKHCIIILTILFSNYSAKSQTDNAILLGETVPDVSFQVYNDSERFHTLKGYNGKLIIVDFWATWCTPCIKKFPMLDSMQKEYPDKIQILLVNSKGTTDKESDVKLFLEKWIKKHNEQIKLPIVILDTTFEKLFKHRIVGQYIWIAPDGTLLAETTSEFVTRDAVEIILNARIPKRK